MKYRRHILAVTVILTNLCCLSGRDFVEMRAVWFTTAWLGDWPEIKAEIPQDGDINNLIGVQIDQMKQKQRLVEMLDSLKEAGCNTIMFQTVSFMDAMHKSRFLPWSRYLTGTEGEIPLFDPLAVAVEHCRQIGLDIHAWINPYRIGDTTRVYSGNHPMRRHSDWVQEYKGSYYWNPGIEGVRGLIADIAAELLENYDIDGIHIDDYFYPSGLQTVPDKWDDSAEYLSACKDCDTLSLDQWRYSNVDATIELLRDTVHSFALNGKSRLFGVSPAGRLVNTQALYADPRRWTGLIDYIVPQIYWATTHRLEDARFSTQIRLWPEEITPNVPVVAGMAIYRYGYDKRGEIFDDNEYLRQVELTRSQKGICGQMWFSARGVLDHFDLIRSFYASESQDSSQEKFASEESED